MRDGLVLCNSLEGGANRVQLVWQWKKIGDGLIPMLHVGVVRGRAMFGENVIMPVVMRLRVGGRKTKEVSGSKGSYCAPGALF